MESLGRHSISIIAEFQKPIFYLDQVGSKADFWIQLERLGNAARAVAVGKKAFLEHVTTQKPGGSLGVICANFRACNGNLPRCK